MKALLDYQTSVIEDKNPVVVVEKSRRIGLSWCIALLCVAVASLIRSAGGMNCWYVGYNKDMAEEFIRDCAFWAKELNGVLADVEELLLEDERGDIQAFRIKFASGFRITALSSRPSNLRGKQGLVVIDEAAFHENLSELLKAALAMLVWGGRVIVLSTHDGAANPFNELCEDIRAGRKPYSLHRIDFDQALAAGLYKRICAQAGRHWSQEAEAAWRQEMIDFYGEDADEELFCIPRQSGGSWLTRNLVERCMDPGVPVIRYSPPAPDFVDWPVDRAWRETRDWCEAELTPLLAGLPPQSAFFGEDFGRSGDLTVIWPLLQLQDLNLATPFVLEVKNAPFRTQEQLLRHICDRLPRLAGGALDARGNGQALAEYARQSYGAERIREVMLSEGWYREHMPKLKAGLEDRAITLPRDADILEDLRGIKLARGVARPPEARRKGAGGQRHCDSAVALALAVYAAKTMEDVGEFEVRSMPRQSRDMLRGYDA